MPTNIAERIDATFEQAYMNTHEPEIISTKAFIVMQSMILNLISSFSKQLMTIRVSPSFELNEDMDLLLSGEYKERLNYWLKLSGTNLSAMPFGKLKLHFEDWFYYITANGTVEFEYQDKYLLTTQEACKLLKITKPTLLKYIDQGLEAKRTSSHKRIPKHAIDFWLDDSDSFTMQWIFQIIRMRTESLDSRLERIEKKIEEFVHVYNGTFDEVFGHLSLDEADIIPDATNYYDWKLLEEQKEELSHLIQAKKGNH